MIEVEIEFKPGLLKDAVKCLLSMPEILRPSHHSFGENDKRKLIEPMGFVGSIKEKSPGPYLTGDNCSYHFSLAGAKPIILRGEIDVEPDMAWRLMLELAGLGPIFGFACSPDERRHRNHVVIQQGINSIENWIGRDSEKYIPGIYWLTLLPDALLKKHNVPISVIEQIARKHIVLAHEGHLLSFYDRPEEWRNTSAVTELCSSLSGVFDIGKVRPMLLRAKTFLELNSIVREWG